MATRTQTYGLRSLRVNGVNYAVGDSITAAMAGEERESVAGLTGPTGYSKRRVPKSIEVEVRFTRAGLPLHELATIEDAEIQAETRDGSIYILSHAHGMGAVEEDVGMQTATIRFETEPDNGRVVVPR